MAFTSRFNTSYCKDMLLFLPFGYFLASTQIHGFLP
jgi:glycopeptide antibiotics resistance protein